METFMAYYHDIAVLMINYGELWLLIIEVRA